jgi:hypothetical protein
MELNPTEKIAIVMLFILEDSTEANQKIKQIKKS